MQTMFIPTLAWVEGVIVVLAIVLTAGGWIVNVVKKVNEAAAARKARQAEKEQALRQQFQLGGADRLPERGVEARASVNPQLDLQPDNLTAAQRAARDRARAAYQRRAELLAKQRQTQQPGAARASSSVQGQQSSSSSSSSSSSAAARQQQAQAARQAQRVRQQAAQQQAQHQEQVRLAQARQQAQQRAAAAREAAVRDARRVAAIEPPMEVEEVGEPQRISRSNMETGAGKRESTSGIDAGALRNALGGRSLRAAFVLKEVLDRPVGLRPPQDQPGMGTYI